MSVLDREKCRFLQLAAQDQGAEQSVLHQLIRGTNHHLDHLLQAEEERVTVDSLAEWMEGAGRCEEAPTLLKVLHKEETISVLNLLPQIIQLQLHLFNRFNKRLSLAELSKVKVDEFVEKRELDEELVAAYFKAWEVLKLKVVGDGSRDAEEMIRFCEEELDPRSVPALFLIPAATGPGVCAANLTRLMIQEHNALASPDIPATPLNAVNSGHGIQVQRNQVEVLLLSHTTYSLVRDGDGLQHKYDLKAMEKQLTDKYLVSKARIESSSLPLIQFQENIQIDHNTLNIKIKQEESLSTSLEHMLDVQIKSIPDISRIIENIDVAREFLLQIGNRKTGNESLVNFMGELRLVVEVEERSGLEQLQLRHIDSALAFLARMRAERCIRGGHNPFEQIVPVEYREDLGPEMTVARLRDIFIGSSPALLFPPLFNFTLEYLRIDHFNQEHPNPQWELKDVLENYVDEDKNPGELEAVTALPSSLLLKHIISFIIKVVHNNTQ